MRKILDDVSVNVPLVPAPHWTCLTSFGGYLSITAFRRKHQVRRVVNSVPEGQSIYAFGYNFFEEKIRKKQIVMYNKARQRGHNLPQSSFVHKKKSAVLRCKHLKKLVKKAKLVSKPKFGNVHAILKSLKNKKTRYKKIKL